MEFKLEHSLPVILGSKSPKLHTDRKYKRFSKHENISITSGIQFVNDMLELQSDDPQREYYSRKVYDDKPTYLVHWGQRKLLLNEIAFLTYFWDPKEVPDPVIVYVGAAAGDHIPILLELFPQISEMHLYDPAKFSIRPTDKIFIYNQLFTKEDAEIWDERDDIFFISDIRVREGEYDDYTQEENERGIVEDHQRQLRWVEIINPVQAHLKFRTPFPVSKEFYEMEYFDGIVFFQPWAPINSTETRLIPSKGKNGKYKKKIWDSKKHEEQLFYHNTVLRDNLIYNNPFLKSSNSIPIDPPELLNDYDSVAETIILRDYLVKMGKKADKEDVITLSRYITKRLNEQGKTYKTINSIRNYVLSDKYKTFTPKHTSKNKRKHFKGRGRGRGRSRGRGRGRGRSRDRSQY